MSKKSFRQLWQSAWHSFNDKINRSTSKMMWRKSSSSASRPRLAPPSHSPSTAPSFHLWSLPSEPITAKWSYRVSPPSTDVYRTGGAEQPFNKAEWILLLCAATFPKLLPRTVRQFLWPEEGHEGTTDVVLQTNGERVWLTEREAKNKDKCHHSIK